MTKHLGFIDDIKSLDRKVNCHEKKKRIVWLFRLLTCSFILLIFLFLLDKPRVVGFTLLSDRPLVFSQSYQSFVWMGVEGNSDRYIPVISFMGRSFRNDDKIYCGYKNSIRIYDLKYQFLSEIDISILGIPKGTSFHGPLKKISGAMWWAAGQNMPEEIPLVYSRPHGIIYITMLENTPKAVYYEIGEYAGAVIQDDGKSILIFRKDQPYYEIYDTASKSFKSQVAIKNYNLDWIGGVSYDDMSKKIVIYGNKKDNKENIIGYIKDQEFKLIDSSAKSIGGLVANNTLFYIRENRLFQYDLNSGIRVLIFAPPIGSFYSSYNNSVVYDQENNFLCFTYSYRSLIGKRYMNSLFLDLKTKQYYLEIPMPPP